MLGHAVNLAHIEIMQILYCIKDIVHALFTKTN